MEALNAQFIATLQAIQAKYTRLNRPLQLRVERWVTKLSEESSNVTFCKNRNDHAVALLQAVDTGEFEEPFCRVPSDAALANLPSHLQLRVRSAARLPVRPASATGAHRRTVQEDPSRRVWSAAIASTAAGMATPQDPEIYPRFRPPQVDHLMAKAIQHKNDAAQWMKRHSECFRTQSAECSGLAGCTCHCNTSSKKTRCFGTGTLASFPKRHVRGSSLNRHNPRFSRIPVVDHPKAESYGGPAWTDADDAWAVPSHSITANGTESSGQASLSAISHEDIHDKPEERRSRRVSSLLRKLGKFSEGHAAATGVQAAHSISQVGIDEANALEVDLHPKQASLSIREADVQKALQRTEIAHAREEAVTAKFEQVQEHRRLQASHHMNARLQFLLSDMSDHVEQLRNRCSSTAQVHAIPAPYAYSAVPEQPINSDAATMTEEPVYKQATLCPPPVTSHGCRWNTAKSHPQRGSSGITPNKHQSAKGSAMLSPCSPSVVARLSGGDEIDREAARYGPAVAGKFLSTSHSQVSPISDFSTSKTEFPVFIRKDRLNRKGAIAVPVSPQSLAHKMLEKEGSNLADAPQGAFAHSEDGLASGMRSAAFNNRRYTASSGTAEDDASNTSCLSDGENRRLPQHAVVVLSTSSHHQPERKQSEARQMSSARPAAPSVQMHASTFNNPSWNVPIVPMVLPISSGH